MQSTDYPNYFHETLPPYRCGRSHPAAMLLTILMIMTGCAMAPGHSSDHTGSPVSPYQPGDIIHAQSGKIVSFETLIEDLASVKIVYVGEQHNNADHHTIQTQVIRALQERHSSLKIGMEMFDRSYQRILDEWSSGSLERQAFIEKSHWYANWKYDFGLYAGILDIISEYRIPLIALNIPFHIPAKIAVGGLDNLRPEERRYLPNKIDTANADHRAYVKSVHDQHQIPGRENFEFFYSAQCVWEDAMAEAVAGHLAGGPMIVLAGNGHIVRKFGIPDRVFSRSGASYRTIYPLIDGQQVDASYGDYIWITPKPSRFNLKKHT
ncbi:MAG: ChaN family lipoprotein [Desulfobacteraceae bacterium]|nr:ChaN family lipoprotein [Desulfobacteraceae bacterium]